MYMKHARLMFYVSMALMVLMAACAPASTPTATAASAPPANTSAATDTSVPAATSTTAPLDLAGPPMQVGSTYLYFDGALLVAVPGGPFVMGHGGSDNPQHTVTLGDFWIYSTKVTNREYQQCVAVGKCTTPDLQDDQGYNDLNHQSDPVAGVNWMQGEAYCDYAHGNLPTEAQWEKAARGPDGNVYPWGNNAPGNDLLNYNNTIGHTTNVINYPKGKSYYDALDMEGNAYEWVYDWYDFNYYRTGIAQDPLGPDTGQDRSVRSAGYQSNNDQVPASTRSHKLPDDHARYLGFRCVVKDPTFFAPMCTLTALVGSNLGGSSGPASGQPTCPKVNVSVGYYGCGAGATAVVTFDDSLNPDSNESHTTPIPVGCTAQAPGSHVAQWTCTSAAGNVSITTSAHVPVPINVTCPAHYNLVGSVCQWDKSGTAGQNCPAGSQYDPTNKCCTSTPGTGANFPACPAGTVFQNVGGGVYECLPAQNACPNLNDFSSSAAVGDPQAIQGACGNNNPGGGNNCTAAQNYCDQYCKYGCKIDPNTCQITYCNRG
jgi:formylglycine-generating enzyme required for sulfatase activity